MDPLVTVHVIVAVALVVLALLVGVWGMVRARVIGADAHPREGRVYAQLLQLTHTFVFAIVILGGALLVKGYSVADPLHARVYGPFMLVAIIAAYGYRTKVAATNIRIFAISALVVFLLGLRAIVTGG